MMLGEFTLTSKMVVLLKAGKIFIFLLILFKKRSMRPILAIFVLCMMSVIGTDSCQSQIVSDPVELFVEPYKSQNTDSILGFDREILVKIVHDFNNDGIDDIAIANTYLWGNAGGPWDIFIGTENKQYRYLGSLSFHPDAIAFKPLKHGMSLITVYLHRSAREGDLVEYRLSAKRIKKLTKKILSPDPDTQNEDYQKFRKLFGYLHQPISVWCRLSEYLKNKNCRWDMGYYPK